MLLLKGGIEREREELQLLEKKLKELSDNIDQVLDVIRDLD